MCVLPSEEPLQRGPAPRSSGGAISARITWQISSMVAMQDARVKPDLVYSCGRREREGEGGRERERDRASLSHDLGSGGRAALDRHEL